jgi:hypothetical protein
VELSSKKYFIFIIYDGIKNSVFQSQVLQPILNILAQQLEVYVTLISFERHKMSEQEIKSYVCDHERLQVVLLLRLPFFGKISLLPGVFQLRKVLKKNIFSRIVMRGPFVGYLAQKVLKKMFVNSSSSESEKKSFPLLTIQARGLCAEEFRYAFQEEETKSFFCRLFYKTRYRMLYNLEKSVYGGDRNFFRWTHPWGGGVEEARDERKKRERGGGVGTIIEAVSPALRNYLISEFGATVQHITISSKGFPAKISEQEKKKWRIEIRQQLNISSGSRVFCYSGSHKPWQCIPETLSYFVKRYQEDPSSVLLIFSRDKKAFLSSCSNYPIPQANLRIISIPPQEVVQYICAADIGLLFRKKDVVNWVSRPTKMLEYQAVGLQVVHNGAVAWLGIHEEENDKKWFVQDVL